ncbi:MAG: MFS transporter [Frankia sp.]|nr:MFS transporter [Frankia sp.]
MTGAAVGAQAAPVAGAQPWAGGRRVLTAGLVATITLVAFESLAVVTVAPKVSADLHGLALYGWLTSAFFLTTVVGLVLGGAAMDGIGPVRPFVAGLVLFGAGLAVAAAAPTMHVLVVARGLQGFGNGVITTIAYATIGRAYPRQVRPKVFAILSTAWVVPSVGGPALAAVIAERAGWRWVFGGLIPLVVLAGGATVHALCRLPATAADDAEPADVTPWPAGEDGATAHGVTAPDAGERTWLWAMLAAGGAGLALAGLSSRSPYGIPLLVVGAAAAVVALRRLLPPGTARARPGAPAAVAVRGLLTFAFFGTDTFVPLAITSVRHHSTAVAGVAVTVSAMAWTAGSWTQARLASRRSGRFLVTTGLAVVLLGITGTAVLLLVPGVPLAAAIAAWGVAGYGIGLCYSPILNVVLNAAPPEQQGKATSAVGLTDNLGVVLGTGIGGVAVAAFATEAATTAGAHGSTPATASTTGLAVAFGLSAVVGLLGVLVARRLPAEVLAPAPVPGPPPASHDRSAGTDLANGDADARANADPARG